MRTILLSLDQLYSWVRLFCLRINLAVEDHYSYSPVGIKINLEVEDNLYFYWYKDQLSIWIPLISSISLKIILAVEDQFTFCRLTLQLSQIVHFLSINFAVESAHSLFVNQLCSWDKPLTFFGLTLQLSQTIYFLKINFEIKADSSLSTDQLCSWNGSFTFSRSTLKLSQTI